MFSLKANLAPVYIIQFLKLEWGLWCRGIRVGNGSKLASHHEGHYILGRETVILYCRALGIPLVIIIGILVGHMEGLRGS